VKRKVGQVVLPHERPDDLARWLEFLHTSDCTCSHVWAAGVRLHGVMTGPEWARKSTEPECPHHGTEAVRAWERRTYSRSRR
jgi:hypothetical protein